MKGKLPFEVAETILGDASSFSLALTFMGGIPTFMSN